MDTVKKIWPLSFNAADTTQFVINLIIYLAAPTILNIAIGFIPNVVFFGWVLSSLSSLGGLYCTVGLVLLILYRLRII